MNYIIKITYYDPYNHNIILESNVLNGYGDKTVDSLLFYLTKAVVTN